jgi:hypothetical protein
MSLQKLRELLAKVPSGLVPADSRDQLVELLKSCWTEFEGGDESRMKVYKLDRIKDMCWCSPLLSFIIVRHGRAAQGSKRAERQRWDINIQELVAKQYIVGSKLLSKSASPVNFRMIAEKIMREIDHGPLKIGVKHNGIIWKNADSVAVKLIAFLPASHSNQTSASRSRRLGGELVKVLGEKGWKRCSTTRYEFIKT